MTLCTIALHSLDGISEIAILEVLKDIQRKKELCPHSTIQRFGPSYVARSDGSYQRIDSTVCKDCGYSKDSVTL